MMYHTDDKRILLKSMRNYVMRRTFWFLIAVSFFGFFSFCGTTEVKVLKRKEETPPKERISPKELRLTYHAVWAPKYDFELLESGSLHGTGNTYTIRFKFSEANLVLRMSSTDRENQSQFPYLQKDGKGKEQVFYFPWKDKKATVVVWEWEPGNCYIRWEGIHNGFLLVFESKMPTNEMSKTLAESFHSEVQKSLDVY
ncbi:MAG: hypothetical protein O9301_10735 [Leptospira sp.]|nr:hypothetical protein [Leptospira sp.]